MPHGNFVHLRTHSAYSLSEGAIKISNLIELALQNNMPAIGLTDKGNLFGAMEFSEKAKESGLQPILGLELAITDKNKGSLVPSKKEENLKPNWIVLLTQSEIGWQNLMALSSKAYLDTPPTEVPQVNFEKLSCHSDGLIALSGGPDGPIGRLIQKNKIKEAYNITDSLSKSYLQSNQSEPSLQYRGGSSRQAIVKYIQSNYKVGENSVRYIKAALIHGVESKTLTRTKGAGAAGSLRRVCRSCY